jgi:hypothetical protein
MSPAKGRRRPCTPAEARTRLRHAEAFFATAELVASEEGKPTDYDYNHVAAGVAVLAAIAAADALCCHLLGERSRGQDHRQAIELLEQVRYGAASPTVQTSQVRELGQALATALDVKDESHYGTRMLTHEQVVRVMRAAEKLVVAARAVVRGEQ